MGAYLAGKTPANFAGEVCSLLAEYDVLMAHIHEYVRDQLAKKSPFTATRAVGEYLYRNDRVGLKWIKMDGCIRSRTAHRIREQRFMLGIFPLLKAHFEDRMPISFVEVTEESDGYVYMERNEQFRFSVRHEELLKFCGFLTNEETDQLSLKALTGMSLVIIDHHSLPIIVQQFNRLLRGSGWAVEEDSELDQLAVRHPAGDEVYEFPIHRFIQNNRVAQSSSTNTDTNTNTSNSISNRISTRSTL